MVIAKWPKKLVIVRHGESELNLARDLLETGSSDLLQKQHLVRDVDIPLTEKGVLQAEQTGKWLSKQEKFDICFSSPYQRALQTAEGIISQFDYDLSIYKDNRLREKEFGSLHGLSKEEIKERYPDEYNNRERDGKYWYRLPSGENYPDVEARIHSFLDKLSRDYSGKNVLVATHQVCYKMFRALFEHLGEEEVLALEDCPNCGVQEYGIKFTKSGDEHMSLVRFNEAYYKEVL